MRINFTRLNNEGFDVQEHVNEFDEKCVDIRPANGSSSLARKVLRALQSETSLSEQENHIAVDGFIGDVQTVQIMRVIKES